jgi:hypothetical protein
MLKSFIAYFGNSLLLSLFILLCLKFSIDQCAPRPAYRIFNFNVNVPHAVCEKIKIWDGNRKHELSKRIAETGGTPTGAMAYFMGNTFLEKIGISDLPLLLNSDLKKQSTIVAILIVVLIFSVSLMIFAKAVGDIFVFLFVGKEEIEKDYMAVYPPPKKPTGPNSVRTKATRELLTPMDQEPQSKENDPN